MEGTFKRPVVVMNQISFFMLACVNIEQFLHCVVRLPGYLHSVQKKERKQALQHVQRCFPGLPLGQDGCRRMEGLKGLIGTQCELYHLGRLVKVLHA